MQGEVLGALLEAGREGEAAVVWAQNHRKRRAEGAEAQMLWFCPLVRRMLPGCELVNRISAQTKLINFVYFISVFFFPAIKTNKPKYKSCIYLFIFFTTKPAGLIKQSDPND